MSAAITKFAEDLVELRRRYLSKYHIHPASIVGCLHMEIAVIESGSIANMKARHKMHPQPDVGPEGPFKVGDHVKISPKLFESLVALGMVPETSAALHNKWAGVRCDVQAVWQDPEKRWWVTADLCVEIPATCCELAERL